ncbi:MULTISPECIES: HlyD family secretion protein [Chryseobacterium]|jgi:multidrug resistance efflux pump|uniref:biotin/lipoyl-binding protein n=1 Tax=Chryseobacterium TaxID=59732 RepID=UPI000B08BA4F|nr:MULTISPECIES: biotin/lipoyl-binding protein [Chryseobacterium]
MKIFKNNLVYIIAFFSIFIVIYFFANINQENIVFYGVAINRETEIKCEQNIRVEKILVRQGQKVKKGDILLIVSQGELKNELTNNKLKAKENTLFNMQNVHNLSSELNSSNLTSDNQLKQIDLQIQQLETEKQNKIKLIEQFSNVDKNTLDFSEIDNQINLLQEQKREVLQSARIKEKHLGTQINQVQQINKVQSSALRNTTYLLEKKVTQLEILAPEDGIVGNILCEQGENVPSFQLLLMLSELTASSVQGYIYEDIPLDPKKGDFFIVQSIRDNERSYLGKINEIGSRLVEIPPRLRKIQEVITYGRDISIEIPKNNKLLQNEKVMITFAKKKNGFFSLKF